MVVLINVNKPLVTSLINKSVSGLNCHWWEELNLLRFCLETIFLIKNRKLFSIIFQLNSITRQQNKSSYFDAVSCDLTLINVNLLCPCHFIPETSFETGNYLVTDHKKQRILKIVFTVYI